MTSPSSIALHLLPDILKTVWDNHPDLLVEFHRGSRTFIRNSLRERTADFALVLSGEEFSSYEKRVVAKGVFGLYRSFECEDSLKDGFGLIRNQA